MYRVALAERYSIAERYNDAWNRRDVEGVLQLLHPKASYHDAFWKETSSGVDLRKYFKTEILNYPRWYRLQGGPIPTTSGMIARYVAFDRDDPAGVEPLYNGATIFTLSGDMILTISEHYCDPNQEDLIAIADLSEARHSGSHVAPLGLSSRTSSDIRRRLKELAANTSVYRDPSLTVTQLAEHVDCSVKHLFHVLEEVMDTTFCSFVNECRCRYASGLLLDSPDREVRFDRIAEDSGFESVVDFRKAFIETFGLGPDQYLERFQHRVTGFSSGS